MAPNRFLIFATNTLLASPTRGGKPYLGKLRDYLSHSLDQNIDSFELFQCENIEATLNGIATSSAQELNEQIQPVAIPDVPTNMINEIIALWSELLGREVNSTNDFFRSGGDSLIATKMISQLHQRGYPATLQQIFTYPCLADFCAHLEQEKQSQRVLLFDTSKRCICSKTLPLLYGTCF